MPQADPFIQTATPPTPAAGQSAISFDTNNIPHFSGSDGVAHGFLGEKAAVAAATTFTADAVIPALTINIPVGFLQVGTTFLIKATVQASALSTTMTLRPRIGTAGTTADALPCGAVAAVGSATVTTATTIFECMFTVRTLGSSGVAVGSGWAIVESAATTNTMTFPSALTSITVNTTVANILTVSFHASTGTGTVFNATAEIVKQ